MSEKVSEIMSELELQRFTIIKEHLLGHGTINGKEAAVIDTGIYQSGNVKRAFFARCYRKISYRHGRSDRLHA